MLERLKSLRALDLEVASRASIAVVVPLVVLVLVGRIDWAAYASFGAMASLYGRNEPYRLRARTVSVAAAFLLVSVAAGLALSVTGASLPVLVLGLMLVITAGILLASTFGLFPGTPIFFVFAYLVCAQVPAPAHELLPRLLVAVASAALAWLLTMSGWAARRLAGDRFGDLFKQLPRMPLLRPAAFRDAQVWFTILQNLVGVLLAGGLALSVGIGHPYWAVVSVVAVLPPPRAAHSLSRAGHRIVGTVLGVAVTALVLLPGPSVWVLILVIAIGQFGAEILIGKHYGAALLFVTPLALTVAHLADPVAVPTLLVDRVVETALGGVVAVLIVLTVRGLARRRSRRLA
ncbi:FUSC family protein [Cryobacterium sinapicolor]|uniref:FUSC family protein n=1 Tax=Cryobacterium sinapicolor TaxID=1259236 RepID=A0ABY2JDP9_9MICO|nr:FUSC family protein [Cryobacterium sp. TMT3-29-2]TFD03116.1 FUSC family protein [Cryobacterium sinapicolor]